MTDATIVAPALSPLTCDSLHSGLLGLCVIDLWVRLMFMCCMSERIKGFLNTWVGKWVDK